MSRSQERSDAERAGAASPASAEAFAESLRQRRRAAAGLEQDLLTEVPLLYGSPGSAGDPGILLEQLHQRELVGRNGGGLPSSSRRRTDVALPFERATVALAFLLGLLILFLRK